MLYNVGEIQNAGVIILSKKEVLLGLVNHTSDVVESSRDCKVISKDSTQDDNYGGIVIQVRLLNLR